MQTSRMTEMGLSTERIFEECSKAGEFHLRCAVSIGRDLSNDVRVGEFAATAAKCELATGEPRLACMRGVVYALIDNTWDGRYALPFCAALSRVSDRSDCYRESVEYLKDTFAMPAGEITKQCAKHLRQPERCMELAAR